LHGMSCTGAVWSGFKSVFESHGVRVYTPTLRPDVRLSLSEPPHPELRGIGLEHYVADLERELDRVEEETGLRPAVIGHSMGGLLAQVLAERGRIAAGVFITPAAPAGVGTFQTRLFWLALTAMYSLRLGPWAFRPKRRSLERSVFNALPADARQAAHAAMVYESGRAFRQLARWPIDESKIHVPVLTVAASQDRLIPAAVVRQVARKYESVGGDFLEYRDHGHWLYAEPGWEKPASDIYTWLAAHTP